VNCSIVLARSSTIISKRLICECRLVEPQEGKVRSSTQEYHVANSIHDPTTRYEAHIIPLSGIS
jgi:hypothetical protein